MSSEIHGNPAGPPELIVVADPQDEVAVEVTAFVTESGHRAELLDVFDAAQLFTVEVRDGTAAVTPELPMFLRPPEPPLRRTGFDAEFQLRECLAQLWAVAALTRAPVINRPAPGGPGSLVSYSAALTELRAGLAAGPAEILASRPPAPPVPPPWEAARWWIQDRDAGRAMPWTASPDGAEDTAGLGPFRARWSDPDPVFEGVVVLAGRAWRCSGADLDELGLEERSVAIAGRLGLTLAALTWRVAPDLSGAALVGVEPFPALEQLRMVWLGFGPRLLEVLFP